MRMICRIGQMLPLKRTPKARRDGQVSVIHEYDHLWLQPKSMRPMYRIHVYKLYSLAAAITSPTLSGSSKVPSIRCWQMVRLASRGWRE